MTRKNYLAAVKLIVDAQMEPAERKRLAELFMQFFREDNCRFCPQRFLDACKLEKS